MFFRTPDTGGTTERWPGTGVLRTRVGIYGGSGRVVRDWRIEVVSGAHSPNRCRMSVFRLSRAPTGQDLVLRDHPLCPWTVHSLGSLPRLSRRSPSLAPHHVFCERNVEDWVQE